MNRISTIALVLSLVFSTINYTERGKDGRERQVGRDKAEQQAIYRFPSRDNGGGDY